MPMEYPYLLGLLLTILCKLLHTIQIQAMPPINYLEHGGTISGARQAQSLRYSHHKNEVIAEYGVLRNV